MPFYVCDLAAEVGRVMSSKSTSKGKRKRKQDGPDPCPPSTGHQSSSRTRTLRQRKDIDYNENISTTKVQAISETNIGETVHILKTEKVRKVEENTSKKKERKSKNSSTVKDEKLKVTNQTETAAEIDRKRCMKSSDEDQIQNNQEKHLLDQSDQLQNKLESDYISPTLMPFSPNFNERTKFPLFQPSVPHFTNTNNFINHILQRSLGNNSSVKKSVHQQIIDRVTDLELYRTGSPFERRVTAIEWHPSWPHIVAVGDKGGEIILWDINNVSNDYFIPGMGPGGSIQAMKFWPRDDRRVVTASIDGTVTLQDFEGKHRQIILDTMNCHDFWYCSLDVNKRRSLLVAGENSGKLALTSLEGKKVFEARLHKGKITHCEFSPREDWLLCTASIDHTVQFWDLRMLKDRKSTLQTINHEKGVNSAYFSLTDSCRLLTTDQHSAIKVFSAPLWELETTIVHPHRQFQHLTPIKAHWHPLQDLIVVGRYPDPNFPGFTTREPRSIDFFEASTGKLVYQLYDPAAPGIVSLNKFNSQGDVLCSGMGRSILIWTDKHIIASKKDSLMTDMKKSALGQANYPRSRSSANRSRPSNPTKVKKESKDKTSAQKVKMKMKNSKK
ncbi:DNA damage-binding protein 2 isoform X2 [Lingula anatina]|uniref:DNA damage-binding protein 2 n=1 Tax=Lingula anatina TaxID=7574 RepID=A0A1S3JBN0_LINAN|nr:DNA damage-binding protein 2 isoform X2 [Lingula anatina]|eukprot:XP_013407815.1 DNA damage-binding protein 2 isoform X2 [Lingula anatina]